jgi:DNA processing protein
VIQDELCHLLTLLLGRGSGRRAVRRVIAQTWAEGGSLSDAASRVRKDPTISLPSQRAVDAELTLVERLGLRVICQPDADYPPLLATIPDAPVALFLRGSPHALAAPINVAIVGSRRASAHGCQFARALAADMGRVGFGVISGMAIGIDGAAHRGAIDVSAITVAVVGGGHQHTYPARHRSLASEIVNVGGAIVSEYPPTIGPRSSHFPERNRIISGLAAGVVVVEARTNSGSLITARMALEQGREVMAVPGAVHEGAHGGCHRLLREGAALVEDATDVLRAFGLSAPLPARQSDPTEPLHAKVLAAMRGTVATIDGLMETLQIPVEQLLGALVALEMDGFVESCRGGYIRRPRSTGNSS